MIVLTLIAIGWTLTGIMNSPSISVAWHYPSDRAAWQASNTPSDEDQQQRSTETFPVTSSDVSDASLLLRLGTPFAPVTDTTVTTRFGRVQQTNGGLAGSAIAAPDSSPFNGITIEQQDVAMSTLGLDTMPWFDPMYPIGGHMLGMYGQQPNGQQTNQRPGATS